MKWFVIPQCVMHARSDTTSRRPARRGARWVPLHFVEGLEPRLVLSAPGVTSPVAMLSATQTDSRSITIDYQVNQAPAANQPLEFGIYRSNDAQFDSNATLVDTWTDPTTSQGQTGAQLDDAGQPADALGTHQLTIPLPNGLPIDPQKPYVLVVADPGTPSATTDAAQTASFRTYSIGIVTHGGLQNTHWKNGPAWQVDTEALMKKQGYH